MALRTAFTELLRVEHPVALAPMGGIAGGALAAAVSEAGGLGLVGGGRGEAEWLDRELALVAGRTRRPWGVGFLTWAAGVASVERALRYGPAAVLLSFGDPGPYADRIHRAGALLIAQVVDLAEARRALEAGADVLVAQGSEAGGHGGGGRATLPFVPAVVDLAGDVPVLGAGGVADGRGLAACLALGAAGALVGTRFQASDEALVPPEVGRALVAAGGEETRRNRTLDVARGSAWPERYPARTLRNAFLDRWYGREEELAGDAEALREYREAAARGDLDAVPVWAGEAVDLVTDLRSAGESLAAMAAQAERVIEGLGAVRGRPER